jgi:hypothetical protein
MFGSGSALPSMATLKSRNMIAFDVIRRIMPAKEWGGPRKRPAAGARPWLSSRPVSGREKKAQRIFSLPIYPHLKDEEVDEVIEVVRAAI